MASEKFVTFLRELADWYETHPLAPEPYALENEKVTVYAFGVSDERAVVKALGSFEKVYEGDYFNAAVSIANKKLVFYFHRDKVCTPKVVGRRQVPERVIPSSYVPEQVIAAHEEDVIEWDCGVVLAPQQAAPSEPATETDAAVLTDSDIPF